MPPISRFLFGGCMKKKIEVVIKGHETFQVEKDSLLFTLLRTEGLVETSHCGGNGTCGRCGVRFIKGAPLPKPHDRKVFSATELRDGWRLSCAAKLSMDCIIECMSKKGEAFILSEHPKNKADIKQVSEEKREASNVQKQSMGAVLTGQLQAKDIKACGNGSSDCYVVCDLGTTTIVMQLVEKKTQHVLDTYAFMNPQRGFGADVITRMQKALEKEENRRDISLLVKECMAKGIRRWKEKGFEPSVICISANTVMTHLFLQMDVARLCVYPFLPVTTEQVQTRIEDIKTVFLPGFSAFVGGDLFAGALIMRELMEKENEKAAILIDLGTNGELILLHEDRLFVCATAAGPAFEGGANATVFGSDMVAITAKLLQRNLLDETGLLAEPYFHTGIKVDGVFIRQEDIRTLQMAKAAICAGIRVLLKKAGLQETDIAHVYLAGGFGYKIDVQAAGEIGLLPDCFVTKTIAVGNTALAGAVVYANALMRQEENGQTDSRIHWMLERKRKGKQINLAKEEAFENLYLEAMSF